MIISQPESVQKLRHYARQKGPVYAVVLRQDDGLGGAYRLAQYLVIQGIKEHG